MTADYEAISIYNVKYLGLDEDSRFDQIFKYSNSSHFVYELLQNADDHGATQITFHLKPDSLIIEHNATERFDDRHVKAISSFEDTTIGRPPQPRLSTNE